MNVVISHWQWAGCKYFVAAKALTSVYIIEHNLRHNSYDLSRNRMQFWRCVAKEYGHFACIKLSPCNRVLLEKLLVAQVVKKFRKFYGTILLIAMFTGAYPEPDESSLFFLARSQHCEKRLLASSCLSVRIQQLGSHWTDFHEIWYLWIVQNPSRKFMLNWKMTTITGTLHEDLCVHIYIYISRWILLRMRNVSHKSCRKKHTFFCLITFFSKILPFMR